MRLQSNIFEMFLKLVVFAIYLAFVFTITLPVNSLRERCMVVFSSSEEDYLKVDMKFSKFHEQTNTEGYRILLVNTETHEQEAFQIAEGTFRREFKLTENVIYKLCVKIVVNRQGDVEQNIEYNSGVRHKSPISEEQIKIPSSLLKVSDLKDTYSELVAINMILKRHSQYEEKKKQTQDLMASELEGSMGSMELISYVEFGAVCIIGIFQFFRLKNIIEEKQLNG